MVLTPYSFRPLTGIFFWNSPAILLNHNWQSFRPLTGIFFWNRRKHSMRGMFASFRPLTGIFFWNRSENYRSWGWKKFPSPYGDIFLKFADRYILYICLIASFPSPYGDIFLKYWSVPQSHKYSNRFPSPYGDIFLKCAGENNYRNYCEACFRPLTGIFFWNHEYWQIIPWLLQGVSVPLRGYFFEIDRVLHI